MVGNFRVVINIKKTILYLDKIITNFPAKEKVLRDKISQTMYDILEFTYMASEFKDKRPYYQTKIVVNIRMIDFYLKTAVDKKYISYKKYQKVSLHLLDILKQIYGWMRNEKKTESI